MKQYPEVYSCFSVSDDIRQMSSSGGIFYELAKYVLEQGGVVFGAKFDENFEVKHSCCDDIQDLPAYMGSKYVQSSPGGVYIEIKKFLVSGKKVLFVGTPCQIAGLKRYLAKEYDNLIAVDFICHGVPSRRVWREYKEEISQGRNICSVNFRDKTEGWRDFSLKITFDDGSFLREVQYKNPFIKGFLNNLYLRPACYECRFKSVYHVSDITVGDCWKAEKITGKADDDKGISLVMIHSANGRKVLQEIADRLIITGRPEIELVKRTNEALISSPARPDKRSRFFENECIPVSKRICRLTRKPVAKRVIGKIKRTLGKRAI